MGAGSSVAQVFRKDNPRLKLFVSGKSIPQEADSLKAYFTSLLDFDIVNSAATEKEVEEIASEFCKGLAKHNPTTKNLNKLVLQVIHGLQTVPHDCRQPPHQVQNGLFLVRVFLKHIVENDGASLFLQLDGEEGAWNLFRALVDFTVGHTVTEHTYMTHNYCLQTLLVLLAPQMFVSDATASTTIAHTKPWRTAELVHVLLYHFMQQRPLPVTQPQTGLLHTISNAASFILQLPFHAYTFLFTRPTSSDTRLCDTALLVLLALTVQSPPNPYRLALMSFQDTQFDQNDPEAQSIPDNVFRLSLTELYNVITFTVPFDDRTILLLYYLLHGNPQFVSYVQSRTDLDTLLLPLLHILYHSFEQKPQQIYMILIIILILSQDESFTKSIQQIMLPTVGWYKERYLVDISLGGFIILVLIRTVQVNFTKVRDVYLHTNCLATLANIAAKVSNIHPYVAYRLVKLFELLAKKYMKINRQISAVQGNVTPLDASSGAVVDLSSDIRLISPAPEPATTTETLFSSTDVIESTAESLNVSLALTSTDLESLHSEESTFEDFLQIVLAVLHHTLMHNMWQNPQLVYTLLHEFALFPPFMNHARFGPYVSRIVHILKQFEAELQKAQSTKTQQEWTAEVILEHITRKARTWKNSENEFELVRSVSTDVIPEWGNEEPLQFRYEEENNCAEFFIPYVWCIVYNYSGLIWNTKNIRLFQLKPATKPAIFEEVMDVVFEDNDLPIQEHQIQINDS